MIVKKTGDTVSENERVAASVATLLVCDKQILLGRRQMRRVERKTFQAGVEKDQNFEGWQCPGGYLQKGESIEQSAKRHCLQKAGIEIAQLSAGPYSNNIFSAQLHTTTLYVIAQSYQLKNTRQFENSEDDWRWFNIDNLPAPLYLPLRMLSIKNLFFDK